MRLFRHAAAAAVLLSASARAGSDAAPAAAPPAPAATAPSAAAPSTHLAAAQRLYKKLDLDAAMAELQLADAAAKDNEDETVQVLIYRGLIYSDTGRTAEAIDQFKRALAMRPWVEVPADTSPRIARTFSDARKSLWGMASVRPPQKKAAAAVPASTTQTPTTPKPATQTPAAQTPSAQPAVAPAK
jgi:tetratricopeptide (TPR) repeat protein